MTSITRPDWLEAFGDAIASGDSEGSVRALQSQTTSHAGTAPAAEKRAAVKETLARTQEEALPGIALWFARHERDLAKELGALMLAKSYARHPAEAITELRRLAADANWEVREWAGSATANVFAAHFGELYPVMEDWLRDPSQFVRRAVAIALMGASDRKHPERAKPLLALADTLVRDPAEEVKRNTGPFAVGNALLGKYPAETLEHVRAWARTDEEIVRWNAAMVFVAANARKHVAAGLEILSALAADKRRPVWMAVSSAAKNLAKRDPDSTVPELRRWLLDERKLPASLALRHVTIKEQA
ncbi:MAG: DNA alkylation repair protein [Chloroflexota bacterium]|nr:DNA alkylation repair protein [Chloroflexota bacterium]